MKNFTIFLFLLLFGFAYGQKNNVTHLKLATQKEISNKETALAKPNSTVNLGILPHFKDLFERVLNDQKLKLVTSPINTEEVALLSTGDTIDYRIADIIFSHNGIKLSGDSIRYWDDDKEQVRLYSTDANGNSFKVDTITVDGHVLPHFQPGNGNREKHYFKSDTFTLNPDLKGQIAVIIVCKTIGDYGFFNLVSKAPIGLERIGMQQDLGRGIDVRAGYSKVNLEDLNVDFPSQYTSQKPTLYFGAIYDFDTDRLKGIVSNEDFTNVAYEEGYMLTDSSDLSGFFWDNLELAESFKGYYEYAIFDTSGIVQDSSDFIALFKSFDAYADLQTPPAIADYEVSNPNIFPVNVAPGNSLSAFCQVTNIGNTAGSTSSTLKYYLSTDATYDANDIEVGSSAIGALSVNGSVNLQATISIPDTVADGNYQIIFWADVDDVINESVESNNFATNAISLDSTAAANTNLWTQNGANIFYSTGNVGIGTTNPTELLTVSGKMFAREVQIALNAGADFVFEPDYPLMPLKELEQFVQQNKHLPEIPSEKEMLEDNLSIGEFNIKLLQKIEELTLYMIELKKENETLKQEVELLKVKQSQK